MAERASWAVQQVGGVGQVSVEDARLAQSALWTPTGVVTSRSGLVPAGGEPGMVTASTPTPDGQVHVAPFRAVLQSSRGGGVYTMCLDSVKSIDVLGAAPADAADDRIDLIVWQQNDAYFGDATSDMVVRHVVGTPAATPQPPTVDGSPDYLIRAEIYIPANATTIEPDYITNVALPYTVATGGVLPVASLSERNSLDPYEGMQVYRIDAGITETYSAGGWRLLGTQTVQSTSDVTDPYIGQTVIVAGELMEYVWTGSDWLGCRFLGEGGHARYYADTIQTFPSGGYHPVEFNVAQETCPDVVPTSTTQNEFRLERGGIWHIEAGVRFNSVSGGGQRYLRIANGVGVSYGNSSDHTSGLADRSSLATSTVRRFPAGAIIQARVYQDSGEDLETHISSEETFIAITWLRP